MKNIYLQLIVLITLTLVGKNCYGQVNITLQQAIDSTLNRNLDIRQAKLIIKVSEQNLKQSKLNRLPNIYANPQSSLNWGRTLDVSTYSFINQRVFLVSGSLNTQVALFQGGLIHEQILQNKQLLEADKSNLVKTQNDNILATVTAYLQILANQELLETANQQVKLAKLNVEKQEKGYSAGNKSISDIAQAQVQQAKNQANEAVLQNQLDVSFLSLEQLMDMPSIKLQLIKPTNIKQPKVRSLDTISLFNQALAISPDLRIANYQKEAAYHNVKITKSNLYPSLSVYGSVGSNFSDARSLYSGSQQKGFDTVGFVKGTNQPVITPLYNTVYKNYPFAKQFGDNFYQSLGLILQIPIFSHGTLRTNLSKAKINYENAQLTIQIAKNNLYKILMQAIGDVRTAIARQVAAETNYKATQQILYASEKRYQAGQLNSFDYYSALTDANLAELELIQAKYDSVFRDKVIDYYIGKPLQLEGF